MSTFYNEHDAFAAAWLRNLIAAGELPPGDVDERSIVDLRPGDLAGYAQVHLFAGIGGWPCALRLAGWPDARPIWTGSCPCQPFSAAGLGRGADDPRHLWPHMARLVRACRPPLLMGEQVAAKAGYGWFDGVRADLAAEGYACRGVDIPACAVDAPHIRNRLYWIAVADAGDRGEQQPQGPVGQVGGRPSDGDAGRLADAPGAGRRARDDEPGPARPEDAVDPGDARRGVLADAEGGGGWPGLRQGRSVEHGAEPTDGDGGDLADPDRGGRGGGAQGALGGEGGRAPAERPAGRLGDAEGQRRGEGRAEPELHRGPAAARADVPGVALGDTDRAGQQGFALAQRPGGAAAGRGDAERAGGDNRGYVADAAEPGPSRAGRGPQPGGALDPGQHHAGHAGPGDLADADRAEFQGQSPARQQRLDEPDDGAGVRAALPARSFWSGADWIVCHDAKARRTQPGLPLLAHGVSGRVAARDAFGSAGAPLSETQAGHLINRCGAWKGFGNAIVPALAAEVIRAWMETAP